MYIYINKIKKYFISTHIFTLSSPLIGFCIPDFHMVSINTDLLVMNLPSFCLSENVFLLSLFLKNNFPQYEIPLWQFFFVFSLSPLKMSFNCIWSSLFLFNQLPICLYVVVVFSLAVSLYLVFISSSVMKPVLVFFAFILFGGCSTFSVYR